jgi:phosphoenolpyruvate-protein kinase (PTS system EI component)
MMEYLDDVRPKPFLPISHIKPGNFIWYSNQYSGWDCPAEIVTVDDETRTFTVRSLDDLIVQGQEYDFVVTEHSPESRTSMRAIGPEVAARYLRERATDMQDIVSEIPDRIADLEAEIASDKATIAAMLKLADKVDPQD